MAGPPIVVTSALPAVALAQSPVTGKWEGQTPGESSLVLEALSEPATPMQPA